jgi:alpha-beta hydrolase superfamily lysophospholipase
VQDLVEMVEAMVAKRLIPLQRGEPAYHLYGQSFGGILAFEALAPNSGLPVPRSLTLSNVPSSVPVLLEDVAALLAHLDGDGARFDVTHVCRTPPRPPELLAAYAPGHPGNHWRGVDVIADWCATEPSLGCLTLPVLLLAAEHDFVTPRSMESWQRLAQQRLEIIPGAAHHALLERP